jgi:hypothetical protein
MTLFLIFYVGFHFLEFDLEVLVCSFTHIHIGKAQIIDGPRLIELRMGDCWKGMEKE